MFFFVNKEISGDVSMIKERQVEIYHLNPWIDAITTTIKMAYKRNKIKHGFSIRVKKYSRSYSLIEYNELDDNNKIKNSFILCYIELKTGNILISKNNFPQTGTNMGNIFDAQPLANINELEPIRHLFIM